MNALLIIFTTVLLGIFIHTSMILHSADRNAISELEPGWIDVYFIACFDFLTSLFTHFYKKLHSIYAQSNVSKLVIFSIKYVPLAFYTYKFIKTFYFASREKLRQKKSEIEDIELQIEIVNTKLSVREFEVDERAQQLRESADRLRKLRTRVHKLIVEDDDLKKVLEEAEKSPLTAEENWNKDKTKADPNIIPEHEREMINHLFRHLNGELSVPMNTMNSTNENGEREQKANNEPESSGTSVYSSVSDMDMKKECRVKIVKVTNVFKVAYLKNYIKQTRLKRAAKQAVLVKKVESIRKMLEDWHKTLYMVTTNDPSIRNMDFNQLDMPPNEGMGDYSKSSLRECSNSDSELKADPYNVDEDTMNWAMNPQSYGPYKHELSEDQYQKYYDQLKSRDEFNMQRPAANVLTVLPEETYSQMAIQ